MSSSPSRRLVSAPPPDPQIQVGKVGSAATHPVSVQSMTTTLTADVNATLQQIAELTAAGCDIVRVACPSQDDADALAEIARKSQIPVIADIHFQPKYVYAAIDAGCAAVRVNPGNIRQFDDQVGRSPRRAKAAGVSIRIGVNAGSPGQAAAGEVRQGHPEALVESAVWEASLFEEHDFHDFKISVKHNDPVVMVKAYELLAERGDWPLHLGVTEAGPAFQGTIKSAVAFGALLSKGIGDTIRVSLSAPPVEEVKVGNQILQSLNLRPASSRSSPARRAGAPRSTSTRSPRGHRRPRGLTVPLRVAVMGCVVNGPGEAREADLGVASGNGKGQIFVKGEVIKTVPESQIVETLIEEAMRIAEEMGESRWRPIRNARASCWATACGKLAPSGRVLPRPRRSGAWAAVGTSWSPPGGRCARCGPASRTWRRVSRRALPVRDRGGRTRVRLARPGEVDAVLLPAAEHMFTHEIGYPPYRGSHPRPTGRSCSSCSSTSGTPLSSSSGDG
jgi:(E)-4-hydroxy-3-methylbut-2-enyl-diphosphate synthase